MTHWYVWLLFDLRSAVGRNSFKTAFLITVCSVRYTWRCQVPWVGKKNNNMHVQSLQQWKRIAQIWCQKGLNPCCPPAIWLAMCQVLLLSFYCNRRMFKGESSLSCSHHEPSGLSFIAQIWRTASWRKTTFNGRQQQDTVLNQTACKNNS